MEQLLKLLTTYGAGLAIVGAAIAFIWSVIQFFSVRTREARAREFETFHKLIKELVEPPGQGVPLYADRQCAVLYELIFVPRDYPFTRRMLLGLQAYWSLTASNHTRILEELKMTLSFIEKRSGGPVRRLARSLRLLPAL